MKKTVLLFLFISCQIGAQNQFLDSLKLVVKNAPEISNERLSALNELAYQYHLRSPDSGLVMVKEALHLAKLLDDKKQLGIAYKYMGYNYGELANYTLAEAAYDSAIYIHQERKDWNQAGRSAYNKGVMLSNARYYRKAMETQYTAYSIFEKSQDSTLMPYVLNSNGINQMYLSMYSEAIESYLLALSILEKMGDANARIHADIYSNLGLVYNRLEKYDLALSYYQKSMDINKIHKLDQAMGNLLTNMGNIYDNLDQPLKAISYYERSLEIMTRIKYTYGIASANTNMGIVYTTLNQFDEALGYLEKTKPLFESIKDSYSLSLVYEKIGNIYQKKSDLKYNRRLLLRAKSSYETALGYANRIDNLKRKADIYQSLSEVTRKLNNFKIAYDYQQKATQFKDSVTARAKKEEIGRLEASHEYEKKTLQLQSGFEKDQALKEAEIERQKLMGQIYLYSAGIILVIIGILVYFSNQKRKIKAIAQENEFKKDLAESKLVALRTQLNPHFIFNAMSSIENYMSTHNPEEASMYLIKFSALMRRILHNSEENWITLQEEIDLMKVYVEIESLRMKTPIQFTVDISEHIDTENTMVPSLFIQPFIENSIEHGISKKEDPGIIKIHINEEEDQLSCAVEDNGVGRHTSLSRNKKYKSMGMKIAKERINYINQLTNDSATFEIEDLQEGLKVTLKIPHKTQY